MEAAREILVRPCLPYTHISLQCIRPDGHPRMFPGADRHLANQKDSHNDRIRYRADVSYIPADPAPPEMVGGLDCLLGLAASLAFSLTAHKQYSATAQLLVQPSVDPSGAGTAAAAGHPDRRGRPNCSWSPAPRCSRPSAPSSAAPRRCRPSEVGQTNVIAITATSRVPSRAALIANLYANAFVQYRQAVASQQPDDRRGAAALADLLARQADQLPRAQPDLGRGVGAAQPAGSAEGAARPDAGQRRGRHRRRGAGHARADPDLAEFAQACPGRPARPGRRARPRPGRGVPAREPGRPADLQGSGRARRRRAGAGHDPAGDLLAAAGAAAGDDGRADLPGRRVVPVAADLAAVRPAGTAAAQHRGDQPGVKRRQDLHPGQPGRRVRPGRRAGACWSPATCAGPASASSSGWTSRWA